MYKTLSFLVFLAPCFLFVSLTEVDDSVDAEVVSTVGVNRQISAHVLVTGVGVFDFVSLPLIDGPFKPKETLSNPEAERILVALVSVFESGDYTGGNEYIQKVTFEGLLAVLNRDVLAVVSNIHDCGSYFVEIHRFFGGITITYDCSPEM